MPAASTDICVVGLGPRGLSVLERMCANAPSTLPPGAHLRIHVVDPYVLDGGHVWRTGQSTTLLMNTVASQVTMFIDDSVDCDGPVVAGPSLYEWARAIALLDPFEDIPPEVRAEADRLGPDSYPSRSFYGHYLSWVLHHVDRTAPDSVTIVPHPHRAVDLVDGPADRQEVELDDGERLTGMDAVVLTLGHSATDLTPTERDLVDFAREGDLVYLPPGNPADVDTDVLAAGQPTVLRGLGLNFFDYMALLTSGRGGRFERTATGRLRYQRSGREPALIAGSRRGVPYHSRGENQKGAAGRHEPLFFTADVIADLRARATAGRPIVFGTDVWPLVDHEVRAVYYATIIANRACHCDAEKFLTDYVACVADDSDLPLRHRPTLLDYQESAAERRLLTEYGLAACRWDWHRIGKPYGGRRFATTADFHRWLLKYLSDDVRDARQGNVHGAVKAALDVLRDLRNEIRLVVDHGGLSGDSYRDELQHWYTSFNAFVSIGPPASRIEEMTALIEAGVLTVVGPDIVVECHRDPHRFVASSAEVPGSGYPATALIEARLPDIDLRRTRDPLLRNLLARGECVTHRIPNRDGGYYETGGLAVTQRPYRLLDRARRPHRRRFAFGVPTETVHWVTAAGIRPGVNSVTLGDADAVARESLLVAVRARTPALAAAG